MSGDVTATPGDRRITGPGWTLRAERVEPAGEGGWRALIGVRKGLTLAVTQDGGLDGPQVEAWTGEPEESDGVAVIEAGDGTLTLARVPLCTCGIRGCGNAGVQFRTTIAASRLAAVVDLLRDLPWTHAVPDRPSVLRGASLTAISGVADDQVPPGSSSPYAYAPLTGEYFFPEQAGPGTSGLPPRGRHDMG